MKKPMSPKCTQNVPKNGQNVPRMSPAPSPDDVAIVHPFRMELEAKHIPSKWTDTYVLDRMIEAARVCRALPMRNLFPDEGAGFWPRYPYEWKDLLAQEENVDLDPLPARYRPSAEEISKMNEAIAWPLRYLFERPQHARAATSYSMGKACGIAEQRIAKREGMSRYTLRSRAMVSFGLIADGLNKDQVTIR